LIVPKVSVTYGTSTVSNSWPGKLGKMRHEKVYNLSLGGYGPAQYSYLLRTQAFELKPVRRPTHGQAIYIWL
jgi:hypothetical protein